MKSIDNRAIVVDGKVIGSIGIFIKNDVCEKSGELGYWLSEDYWLQGITSIQAVGCWQPGGGRGAEKYCKDWAASIQSFLGFCTMLYVDPDFQGKGYGRKLVEHWEQEMKFKCQS